MFDLDFIDHLEMECFFKKHIRIKLFIQKGFEELEVVCALSVHSAGRAHLVLPVVEIVLSHGVETVTAPADVHCSDSTQNFSHLRTEDRRPWLSWIIIIIIMKVSRNIKYWHLFIMV